MWDEDLSDIDIIKEVTVGQGRVCKWKGRVSSVDGLKAGVLFMCTVVP